MVYCTLAYHATFAVEAESIVEASALARAIVNTINEDATIKKVEVMSVSLLSLEE